MAADLCPSIRSTALAFAPDEIANDAAVWRRSWGVTRGMPARRTAPANRPPEEPSVRMLRHASWLPWIAFRDLNQSSPTQFVFGVDVRERCISRQTLATVRASEATLLGRRMARTSTQVSTAVTTR